MKPLPKTHCTSVMLTVGLFSAVLHALFVSGVHQLCCLDMYFIEKLIFFFLTSDSIITGITVTYEELKKLNATCYPEDTCIETRIDDSPGITASSSCSCNRLCSHFGTCCLDSFYSRVTPPALRAVCRTVKLSYMEAAYFMVDRCSHVEGSDSNLETLCNEEWDEENDVMKLVPVTSLFTSTTYKNYFCFRCHETTSDFLYWNVWLKSNSTCDVQPEMKEVEIAYSTGNKSWIVTLKKSDISITVDLKFDIPHEIWSLPIECEPKVISNCSSKWTDGHTRDKCDSYTAIIHIEGNRGTSKYKNVHCALCNFESLEKMACKSHSFAHSDVAGGTIANFTPASETEKLPFSFTHLLDINHRDGDKVGKIKRCEKDLLWDPFAKKCRILTCALPGFTIKEGKCTPLDKDISDTTRNNTKTVEKTV